MAKMNANFQQFIKFNNDIRFNYYNLNYICFFFQAGIETDQLTVAFETDAASLFCQIDTKDVNNSNFIQNNIGKEYSYMVIDLGGRSILSLCQNCLHVLLWVVYGLILIKILRCTQVHFMILLERTLPVSIHGVSWTCTTITTVSLRDLQT